jgi:hypothetical protein
MTCTATKDVQSYICTYDPNKNFIQNVTKPITSLAFQWKISHFSSIQETRFYLCSLCIYARKQRVHHLYPLLPRIHKVNLATHHPIPCLKKKKQNYKNHIRRKFHNPNFECCESKEQEYVVLFHAQPRSDLQKNMIITNQTSAQVMFNSVEDILFSWARVNQNFALLFFPFNSLLNK